MADAPDLGSGVLYVRVQVPYPVPTSVKLRYIYKDVPRNSHEILIPYRRTADSG